MPANPVRLAELGEIAAEMAHELRNALLVIRTQAYVGRRDEAAAPAALAKIERHADTAMRIVDAVLRLGAPLTPSAVDVGECVRRAAEAIGDRAGVTVDLQPKLMVVGDEDLLVILLSTLFENAAQVVAPARATVRVVGRVGSPVVGPFVGPAGDLLADPRADRVVLQVEDDGPGVPSEIALRMFEPGVSGRPSGTGFGLALAQRIVRAHGGALTFDGPGRSTARSADCVGATFTITLGAAAGPASARSNP